MVNKVLFSRLLLKYTFWQELYGALKFFLFFVFEPAVIKCSDIKPSELHDRANLRGILKAGLFPVLALLLFFSPPFPLASQQGEGYDSSRNTPGGFLNNYDGRGQAAGTSSANSLSSRPVDLNTLSAREEFRLGVQAYNRYAYNEAILSFERALAYRPGEPLILDWLGRSYYRSGFEDTALRQWQAALQGYPYGTPQNLLLANHIDTIRNRRSLLPVANDNVRYVESGNFPSRNNTVVLYKQPTSILAADDGSVYVVAYGSNEIIRIDVNGVIRQRIRGPINGFDRPFDIACGEGGKF
jgi:tetratricopeptide (TPR) repeat protein